LNITPLLKVFFWDRQAHDDSCFTHWEGTFLRLEANKCRCDFTTQADSCISIRTSSRRLAILPGNF
jgi:hypothetical protein